MHLEPTPPFLPTILSVPKSCMGFPFGSVVKNPPANAGDAGLIPGSGRSPGEGDGNPIQYSYLENFKTPRVFLFPAMNTD